MAKKTELKLADLSKMTLTSIMAEDIEVTQVQATDWLFRTVYPAFMLHNICCVDEVQPYAQLPEFTGVNGQGFVPSWEQLPSRFVLHLAEALYGIEHVDLSRPATELIAEDLLRYCQLNVFVGLRRSAAQQRIFGQDQGISFFENNPKFSSWIEEYGLPSNLGRLIVTAIKFAELTCLTDSFHEVIWAKCFESLKDGTPWSLELQSSIDEYFIQYQGDYAQHYVHHDPEVPSFRPPGHFEYLSNRQLAGRLRSLQAKLEKVRSNCALSLERIELEREIVRVRNEHAVRSMERSILAELQPKQVR